MRPPTLDQVERFHVALARACGQCGLEMRYRGVLAHRAGPGAAPASESGVWSIERRGRRPGSYLLKPAPEVLLRLVLAAPETKGSFTVKVGGATLTLRPRVVSGHASWRAALKRHGVDTEKFLATLQQEAARL